MRTKLGSATRCIERMFGAVSGPFLNYCYRDTHARISCLVCTVLLAQIALHIGAVNRHKFLGTREGTSCSSHKTTSHAVVCPISPAISRETSKAQCAAIVVPDKLAISLVYTSTESRIRKANFSKGVSYPLHAGSRKTATRFRLPFLI